ERGRDRGNGDGEQKTDNHADLWPPGHRRSFGHQVRREPVWHATFLHGRGCRGRRWVERGSLIKFLDFLNTFLDTQFVAHPFRSVKQETKVSIQRSTHGAPPKSASPHHSGQGYGNVGYRKMVPTIAMSYTQAFVSVLRYLRKVRPDEIE